jgi:Putative Actinobacterial Holin-X, holin superfamily III
MAMTTHETNDVRERPLGEVAKDLARDVPLLVRQEIELAKAEMREKVAIVGPALGLIGGALVVALCAAGALTAFLVLALAEAVDAWLAALLVGALLAGAGAVLAYAGKERFAEAGSPLPEQTIENVKEDAQWVKEHARSGRR